MVSDEEPAANGHTLTPNGAGGASHAIGGGAQQDIAPLDGDAGGSAIHATSEANGVAVVALGEAARSLDNVAVVDADVEEEEEGDSKSIDAEALFRRWVEEMRHVMGEGNLHVIDLFHKFDLNGDGVITRAEFATGIQQVNLPTKLSPREVKALVGFIDKDGNDRIDYREFAQNIRTRHASSRSEP